MTRRSLHRMIRWLLPLLAVRALIPVGFMLTLDADGLHLIACPTQSAGLIAALDSAPDANPHAHHATADDGSVAHDAHEQAASFESPCPYALAAVALIATPYIESAPHDALDPPFSLDAPTPAGEGPARADRIRGPPQLS